MPNVTVTVSSVGTSRPVNLDWRHGKSVAITVTGSASTSFAYTVQTTMDDVQLVTAPSWMSDPAATALTANSTFPIVYTQDFAAVRLASTALAANTTLVMKVNQAEI
jgi:hypothetical protein